MGGESPPKGPEMVNISIIQKARQANDEYNSYVDQGLDSGEGWDYALLDQLREEADKADLELLFARDQENCAHDNCSMTGTYRFTDDGVDDDIQWVCEDCGAVLK